MSCWDTAILLFLQITFSKANIPLFVRFSKAFYSFLSVFPRNGILTLLHHIVEHCQYCRSTKIPYCSYILKVAPRNWDATFSI